jgi:hypothetical protein
MFKTRDIFVFLLVILTGFTGYNLVKPKEVLAQNFVPTDNFIENPETSLPSFLPESVIEIFRDLERIVGEVETFLSESGISVAIGDIGLPDILEAIEIFETDNEIDTGSDVFGTQTGSTAVISDYLYRQYLRDLGSEYAQNSTLSLEGQETTAEQLDISQQMAEISDNLAEDSNTQDVSQNILRNISNQMALQQQLDSMQFFATQEDKIARSLNLAVQGETLAGLDSLNVRQDRERISSYQIAQYYQGLMSIPLQHLVP